MVEAGTSAMEAMSQRTELMEELKFNRTEAIRLEEKEERRKEKMEDRILFLSAAVLACIVYYLKNWSFQFCWLFYERGASGGSEEVKAVVLEEEVVVTVRSVVVCTIGGVYYD